MQQKKGDESTEVSFSCQVSMDRNSSRGPSQLLQEPLQGCHPVPRNTSITGIAGTVQTFKSQLFLESVFHSIKKCICIPCKGHLSLSTLSTLPPSHRGPPSNQGSALAKSYTMKVISQDIPVSRWYQIDQGEASVCGIYLILLISLKGFLIFNLLFRVIS